MSTQNSQDVEGFNLPPKWKSGADLLNKMLLSEPEVINMIVRSLVGVDVPDNNYSISQTEWADGSRSDMLYTSTSKSTESPPILIESQYYVDQDFMLRLIKYGSNTYHRYKMLPIVLVIVTKSFSSDEFQKEFTPSTNGLLLETSCKFWAKKCYFLTADAVSNNLNQQILDPMIALGLFLTRHEVNQIPEHHRFNAGLLSLSSTAKEILSKDRNGNSKPGVTHLLNQIKTYLENIIEEKDNQEGNAKSHAKEGLLSIEQLQNDLEDNDYDPSEEQSNITNIYSTEDTEFIESFNKPGKNKNWKLIFNKGKAKNLFRSYKSSDSLKSSYHHIQRRKKQKK